MRRSVQPLPQTEPEIAIRVLRDVESRLRAEAKIAHAARDGVAAFDRAQEAARLEQAAMIIKSQSVR